MTILHSFIGSHSFSRRRLTRVLSFFWLLSVLGPPTHAQPDELVKNGGFEAETGAPDGWAVPAGYGAWDGGQRVSGAKSLRLTNGDAKVYRLVTQQIVCSPGATYTYSAQVKGQSLAPAQGDGNGAGIYLEYYDAQGSWLGGTYLACKSGDFDWTRLGGRIALPLGARRLAVGLYLRPGTTGTAWFDDVSVRADAPPLQSFLRSPNYRGVIAKRNAAPWSTDIVVGRGGSAPPGSPLSLRSEVLDSAGRVVGTRTTPVPARPPDGPLTVEVAVSQSPGAAVVGAAGARPRWRFTLFGAGHRPLGVLEERLTVAAAMPTVFIAPGGAWVVRGAKFFPRGLYLLEAPETSDADLARIAGAGFNTVLCYYFGPAAAPKAFLDRAGAHGLKVLFNLKDFDEALSSFPKTLGKSGARLRAETVSALRGHPALLGWYVNDEGGLDREADFRAAYDQVRSLDADHPCLQVLCVPGSVEGYYHSGDAFGVDPYPVPSRPLSLVSDWADLCRRGTHGAKSALTVAQISSTGNYAASNDGSRPPTSAEVRCMNFLALISGSNGLLEYSYGDLGTRGYSGPRFDRAKFGAEWPKVRDLGLELRGLDSLLLGGAETRVTVENAGETRCRALTVGGKTSLLLANPAPRPQTVTVRGAYSSALVKSGGLTAAAVGRGVTITLPALGSGLVELR